MKKILNWLLKYPLFVLVFLLALSAVSFYFMSLLTVRSDFTVLLPQHFQSVQNMKKMDEVFGGMSHLYVVVEQGETLEQTQKFVDQAKVAIESVDGINYALAKLPIDFFEKRRALYLDFADLQEIDRRVTRSLKNSEKFGTSPIFAEMIDIVDEEDSAKLDFSDIQKKYEDRFANVIPKNQSQTRTEDTVSLTKDPRDEGYYYSPEDQFFVLLIKSQVSFLDLDANKNLLAKVDGVLNQLNTQKFAGQFNYEFTGSYKTLLDQNNYLKQQVLKVFVVIFILLVTLITLFYRNIFYNVLIGLPLLVAMTWSGAITYFLIGHVNVITSFTGFVLLGLGSDYAIFLISRYQQEKKKNQNLTHSLWETYKSAGRASLSAYLTTMAGFVALLFSQFLGFFEFGLVGVVGMTTNYFGILLMMPSLIWLMEKYKLFERGQFHIPALKNRSHIFTALAKLGQHGKLFSVITLGILLFGIWILPQQFQIEFKDTGIENRDLTSWKLEQKVKNVVGRRMRPPTILAKSLKQEKEIVAALQAGETKNYFSSLVYLGMFVPEQQSEKKTLAQKIATDFKKLNVPQDQSTRDWLASIESLPNLKTVTRDNLPKSLKQIFLPMNQGEGVFSSVFILHRNMDLGTHKGIKMLPQIFGDVPLEEGSSVSAIHEGFVISDILNLVETEGPKALGLIFLFLTLVVVFDFRNLKKSLIVLLPMLTTIPLLAAFTYFFGIKLNVLNVSLVPIVFAVGIDSFLHYFHFYDEKTGDLVSISRGILPAVFMATFTSLIGFGGFVVANTQYLRSMGWLSIVGILMVFLLIVLVFPKWIELWGLKSKKT
jgi:hypothetical protein